MFFPDQSPRGRPDAAVDYISEVVAAIMRTGCSGAYEYDALYRSAFGVVAAGHGSVLHRAVELRLRECARGYAIDRRTFMERAATVRDVVMYLDRGLSCPHV